MSACWLRNCKHVPPTGEDSGWKRSGLLYLGHNTLPPGTDPTDFAGTNAILEETEKVNEKNQQVRSENHKEQERVDIQGK